MASCDGARVITQGPRLLVALACVLVVLMFATVERVSNVLPQAQ